MTDNVPEIRGETSGRTLRIGVCEELDAVTVPREFLRVLVAAPQPGDRVELDLGNVSFIDSSGISMLIRTSSYLLDAGSDLVLTSPSPFVTRVLNIAGLLDAFRFDEADPNARLIADSPTART